MSLVLPIFAAASVATTVTVETDVSAVDGVVVVGVVVVVVGVVGVTVVGAVGVVVVVEPDALKVNVAVAGLPTVYAESELSVNVAVLPSAADELAMIARVALLAPAGMVMLEGRSPISGRR